MLREDVSVSLGVHGAKFTPTHTKKKHEHFMTMLFIHGRKFSRIAIQTVFLEEAVLEAE